MRKIKELENGLEEKDSDRAQATKHGEQRHAKAWKGQERGWDGWTEIMVEDGRAASE